MLNITAVAPTRVDLAGGTIDLWPIHNLLVKKATVNVAVSLDAVVRIKDSMNNQFEFESIDQNQKESGDFDALIQSKHMQLFGLLLGRYWSSKLPPITIKTEAKSPAGAGLGGSSCLAIAFSYALASARKKMDPSYQIPSEEILVRSAQDIESRVIHAPTGVQDYWGGVRGGINILQYEFGLTNVTTLPGRIFEETKFSVICCYSGKSRASAINNWEIFKRIFDGDRELLKKLEQIGELSHACAQAVLNKNWHEVLETSKKEWELRTSLWPNIETTETKAIDTAVKSCGAYFSRVCGAGGGGVMAIICPKDSKLSVIEAASRAGGKILEAELGGPGVRCI